MNMDYRQFMSYIEDNIGDYLGDAQIDCIQVMPDIKNNGISEDTLVIHTKDNPLSPVIRLYPYYEEYTAGTSPETIMEKIAADFFAGVYQPYTVPFGHMTDFESVKEDIFIRAVNYERNKDVLEHCPYIRKLDLALTFRVRFYQGSEGLSSLLVDNRLMGCWRISRNFLYEYAMKNTMAKFPPVIESSEDIYTEMILDMAADKARNSGYSEAEVKKMTKEAERAVHRNGCPFDFPLYVITNNIRLNGATAVFYPGVLKKFAVSLSRGGMDFHLLPCSIHEMMIVPYTDDNEAVREYEKIVISGNAEVVRPEEILSDNVYTYTFKNDEISISTGQTI